MRRWVWVCLALILVACGENTSAPTLTPPILFITATPEPTNTPLIAFTATPVIAPLPAVTRPPRPTTTNTPTPVPTLAPSLTPSFTVTYTETPFTAVAPGIIGGGGVLPPAGACIGTAQGGFANILSRDAGLAAALGCATSAAVPVTAAVQDFENGRMLWVSSLADIPGGAIYAAFNVGRYERYADTWNEAVDPIQPAVQEAPPSGKTVPIRGFGKVWGSSPSARAGLGWALGGESGTGGQIQRFAGGEMIYIAGLNQTFIFVAGTWRLDPTPF